MKWTFILTVVMTTSLVSAEPFSTVVLNQKPLSQGSYQDNAQTYIKCWYRPSESRNDPATTWEWALDAKGDYYKIQGYWWGNQALTNMFYTNTPQSEIKKACEQTLGLNYKAADITYYASDWYHSYNYAIWSNDEDTKTNGLTRIVAFGDSLSDTGNMFNGSQRLFPNPNSWFLGRFSNGLVWTEYLAADTGLDLYNWSVGGAAGTNQYIALTGIYHQVSSYFSYIDKARNYNPENTLFTLEFGLNDFMNYQRSVPDVKADLSSALIRLKGSGAKNILLWTLPDSTNAPQFKYSSEQQKAEIKAKIIEFNRFIRTQADLYREQGITIFLYETDIFFDDMIKHPEKYGLENSVDACLDINRSSYLDYLYNHRLTNDCASKGAEKYVFWGVTHPTTAVHRLIADMIVKEHFHTLKH
ncbi:SGNH/GDSL hydrolase family protein [Vibrio caribbeanicus]|uniref:Thermolabile hemolysin (TL)-(Lecithin-dependent hemolysin) (LDH) n=1 Tax=Vibrio caribbeanicus ATCC BAA-2122 TaxID=796620 RepID=E3BK88_9VIBR|nr:SGNH/GDSL hydrolase family protein [Vibrio caribbeanicus]EFP96473.1 Thermolabile hemolysin precursor (TL)-(Lecithin-dependent hemolysin) (LDH) [Vibrio caribbeanicus ATCC BAA-2122]